MLILALLRNLPKRLRATSWGKPNGLSLFSRKVTIVGSGGIALALLQMLAPFDVEVTIVRRRAEALDDEVVPPNLKNKLRVESFKNLHQVLPQTEVLVLAAALTAETENMIAGKELSLLPKHAIVVNVARGEVIHTDSLVTALQTGQISGAGLDVTAPEPLPQDHPLWKLKRDPGAPYDEELQPDERGNVIITPHTADTPVMIAPLLAMRFANNTRALLEAKGLFEGVVDTEYAY